jgi:1-deoxy-D-xylulose-5-phosphate reductoisomerase
MIKLVVLGVSGSSGKQVLRVVKEHKDLFEIVGVSVNTSTSILNDLVNDFPSIKLVGVSDEEKYKEIKDNSLFNVTNNLLDLIHLEGVDMVVNAIVGIAGLKPTI